MYTQIFKARERAVLCTWGTKAFSFWWASLEEFEEVPLDLVWSWKRLPSKAWLQTSRQLSGVEECAQ